LLIFYYVAAALAAVSKYKKTADKAAATDENL
jgi:hypothetical protein